MDEKGETESVGKPEDGGFLKPNIFTLTIPQVSCMFVVTSYGV